MTPLHPRAFTVTVVWTLVLLTLGSIVHATESSLACPDWPTCFGSMVPEMTGGVFWEHLHRLVAGGLLLMFALATWLSRREAAGRPWVFRAALVGMGLLLIQSVFGGLTVLYSLPDLVSTTHLGLAFLFLSLATVLASATRQTSSPESPLTTDQARVLVWGGGGTAALVWVQSVAGALVRHMDAGVSCPDFPLCLGQVIPPLVNPLITTHFVHRVGALAVTVAIIVLVGWGYRAGLPRDTRRWLLVALLLVVSQVALGALSVITLLAIPPVSLHTLVAAALLVTLLHIATCAWPSRSVRSTPPIHG